MVVPRMTFPFGFLIVACVYQLPTVQSVSENLWRIVNGYSKSEAILAMVDKHLKEIYGVTPLHIIMDPKVDDITLSTLLESYMQARSVYLWNNDDLLHTNIASSSMIRRVVGIYSDISHVRPSDQRELFKEIWKPRAKYVVWILGIAWRPIIQTVLENYWSLDSLNVVVIITNPEHTWLRRFTYNPFAIGPYRRGKLVELSQSDKFYSKKLSNLHGYKISISLYDATPHVCLFNHTSLEGATGAEVEALRYLSSWMNFTIVLKSSPLPLSSYTQYIYNDTNHGRVVGPVGDLIKGRSEMLGNSHLFVLASDLDLHFIYPLESVQLQIVVPLDTESSSIAKIFRYVDPLSETLIVIAVGLFSLYVSIVHKRDILITYFRLLFQTNIHPISNRMSERIFMFSWLIFAFIVALAQQTHIMKSLTDLTISQSITTVNDVSRSDLKIVLDQTHFKGWKNAQGSHHILHRTEINPNFFDCILRLGKGERVACVGTEQIVSSGIDTLKKHLIAKRGNVIKQPYIIKTSIYLLSTLIVRNGFPYKVQFSRGHFRMYSFGLMQKWQRQNHVGRFKGTKEFEGPLRFSHFQGVFGLFAICIILANMAFIGEIIYSYMQIKMRK